MSKVLVPVLTAWYDELNSVAFYSETQFERSIRQHLTTIFPDFHGCSYKLDVAYGGKNKRADLILIKNDYSEWWIVEVELGTDNFNHVKQQVETFVRGNYNIHKTTSYIVSKMKEETGLELDKDSVLNLISNEMPHVLVMVDEYKTEWQPLIESLGAEMCIFQVFKNVRGEEIYRLDGKYPVVKTQESNCKLHPKIAQLIQVVSPELLSDSEESIEITYKGRLSKWSVVYHEEKTYLKFSGSIYPLPSFSQLSLFKDKNGYFHFNHS